MLTLFEYFLTDKVGHGRDDTPPESLLQSLDQFLEGVLDELNPARDTLLLTSDHGNLEDTSHTQHTRHPVPLLVYGWAAPYFRNANALTDVTPGIVQALRSSSKEHTSPSP
jgi:phosphopentomutase